MRRIFIKVFSSFIAVVLTVSMPLFGFLTFSPLSLVSDVEAEDAPEKSETAKKSRPASDIFRDKVLSFNPLDNRYSKTEKVVIEGFSNQFQEGRTRSGNRKPSPSGTKDSRVRFRTPGELDRNPRLGEKPMIYLEDDAQPSLACGIEAIDRGDSETAAACARQYVRYLVDVMYLVTEWTEYVGQAFIEEKVIEEEEWHGVPDIIDRSLVTAGAEMGSFVRPSIDHALERVEADPDGKIEILYFFSLANDYSRLMSPDAERVWRLVKDDPRVSMTGLVKGETPESWVNAFREFSDLTMPVRDGNEVARQLNVSVAPSFVVITESNSKAYIISGQQSFENIYSLYRAAQGKGTELTKQAKALLKKPLGRLEQLAMKEAGLAVDDTKNSASGAGRTKVRRF